MDRPSTLLPSILLADDAAGRSETRPRTTRDWVVDTVLFLFAVVGGTLGLYGEFPGGPGESFLAGADLASGVVACAALWWRKRWPVILALALAPVAAYSNSAGLASLVLVFTVAVHRPWSVVAPVAAVHAVGTFVYAAIYPDQELGFVLLVLLIDLFLAGLVAWGMYVRARRELVLSLRERASRAEADQVARLTQAREAERTRIAREMHDVLAHRISLLSMHAGALEFRPDAPPAQIAEAAGVIRASAHQALEDLREVIGVLRSDAGTGLGGEDGTAAARPQPTLAELPALLDESRAAGMRIQDDLLPRDVSAMVPASIGRTAYRVVQEGLTNARKHAAGAGVLVRVTGTAADGLTAEVISRASIGGAVAPTMPGAGTGLVGLSERATLAGGRLEHGPTPEGGFALRAWLPWGTP